MGQEYSNPERESDVRALPDIEVFQLTAREVAERDEDMIREYMQEHRFRLAAMNSKVREAMFDEMIEANEIKGGWFYWFCFPGCMPESDAYGPHPSYKAALKAARDSVED